jgi:hypothetical protein
MYARYVGIWSWKIGYQEYQKNVGIHPGIDVK